MKLDIDPDRVIEVLHVTDTHFDFAAPRDGPPTSLAEASNLLNGITTVQSFEKVLGSIADYTFDMVLHTGDLLEQPNADNYGRALNIMMQNELPLLITPGNHDDSGMLLAAKDDTGLPLRYVDAGNWRIVGLDSYGGPHGGRLGEAELTAMRECCSEWDGFVMIGIHHPPYSTCDHPDCTLADATDFFELAEQLGNIKVVASGHLHDASENNLDGILHLLGPSTCLQLVHVHPLQDHNNSPTKGGVRSIRLHPSGKVESTLHSA